MQPQTPSRPAQPRSSLRLLLLGVAFGCVPIAFLVAFVIGSIHCPIGPMVYGYCNGFEQEAENWLALFALGSYALALLGMLSCMILRRSRLVGLGLLIMVGLFPLLGYFGIYITILLRTAPN